MKKVFLTVLIALGFAFAATAQDANLGLKRGSHIGIGARGGMAGFLIDNHFSDPTDLGFGLGVDLSYAYFFTEHFGLRTGVYFSAIASGMHMDNVESVMSCPASYVGANADKIAEYTTLTPSISENYTAYFFEIPLQLAFRGNHWYTDLGVKFAIPGKMEANYQNAETDIFYHGSYSTVDNTFVGTGTEPIPEKPYCAVNAGYSIFDRHEENNLCKPLFVMAALEAGYRFGCDCGDSWSLGVYVDYAINNIALNNEDKPDLMQAEYGYPHTHFFHTNGALNTNLINSFKLFNCGLKLKYEFGLRK